MNGNEFVKKYHPVLKNGTRIGKQSISLLLELEYMYPASISKLV